jgi:hypothetical protein
VPFNARIDVASALVVQGSTDAVAQAHPRVLEMIDPAWLT